MTGVLQPIDVHVIRPERGGGRDKLVELLAEKAWATRKDPWPSIFDLTLSCLHASSGGAALWAREKLSKCCRFEESDIQSRLYCATMAVQQGPPVRKVFATAFAYQVYQSDKHSWRIDVLQQRRIWLP